MADTTADAPRIACDAPLSASDIPIAINDKMSALDDPSGQRHICRKTVCEVVAEPSTDAKAGSYACSYCNRPFVQIEPYSRDSMHIEELTNVVRSKVPQGVQLPQGSLALADTTVSAAQTGGVAITGDNNQAHNE